MRCAELWVHRHGRSFGVYQNRQGHKRGPEFGAKSTIAAARRKACATAVTGVRRKLLLNIAPRPRFMKKCLQPPFHFCLEHGDTGLHTYRGISELCLCVDVLRYVDRNTSLLYKVRFSTSLHIVVYTVTMSKDIVANGKKLNSFRMIGRIFTRIFLFHLTPV